MIALAAAFLRGFAADRASLALAFAAPIAFFSIFAVFFRHLDADDGMRIEVAVIVASEDRAADRLADALVAQSGGRIAVTRLPAHAAKDERARWSATIEIPRDFDPEAPSAVIESLLPLPGTSDAIRQLVVAGSATRVDGDGEREPRSIDVVDRTRHGSLMRASAPGIPILFVLVALSSLAARGLGDDEAGLAERLRSLGIAAVGRMGARLTALAVIGFAQLGATLLFAALAFGLVPADPAMLATAAAASACACAAFVVLLAELCGNRARFAAIAPVCTLALAGLGGSMVPTALLPDALAWPSGWIFTGWSIEACMRAIDGGQAVRPLLALCLFTPACAFGAALLARRNGFK